VNWGGGLSVDGIPTYVRRQLNPSLFCFRVSAIRMWRVVHAVSFVVGSKALVEVGEEAAGGISSVSSGFQREYLAADQRGLNSSCWGDCSCLWGRRLWIGVDEVEVGCVKKRKE
jgi:hypothetical protein